MQQEKIADALHKFITESGWILYRCHCIIFLFLLDGLEDLDYFHIDSDDEEISVTSPKPGMLHHCAWIKNEQIIFRLHKGSVCLC